MVFEPLLFFLYHTFSSRTMDYFLLGVTFSTLGCYARVVAESACPGFYKAAIRERCQAFRFTTDCSRTDDSPTSLGNTPMNESFNMSLSIYPKGTRNLIGGKDGPVWSMTVHKYMYAHSLLVSAL